jgi:hypothetical protein
MSEFVSPEAATLIGKCGVEDSGYVMAMAAFESEEDASVHHIAFANNTVVSEGPARHVLLLSI